ncbi:uncharacterized protein JN550_012169 [Neoarthrinium moseri]|uniref:uncharacterized protein n=1 Tax=Neoarthrinium moseri TaxID=1658444 RepID=UPI001FDE1DCC|nr:uncharacterized protein JN550_012169 [Neoarthrinium moseri]KAI1859249.1 hypothetical protein JN550_012169 [Neoarthrinium moseri]
MVVGSDVANGKENESYDLSNVANIQATLYEAFGHIELLPFCAMSYAIAQTAGVPLVRKFSNFTDLRILIVMGSVVFSVGAAVCGSAPTMNAFIIGRVVKGLGGSLLTQTTQQYLVMLCRPTEVALVAGVLGLAWVVGLLLGPILGALFAENHHLTWRWAFYIVIPLIMGVVAPLAGTIAPPPPIHAKRSFASNLGRIDWVGFILHSASVVLLPSVIAFSGLTWPWNSGAAITVWVITGLVVMAYFVQQAFSLFTTPEHRLMPVDALKNRTVLLVFIATCMMAIGYTISLYYSALFFAFARGQGPISSAIHMLPLVGTFIACVLISGALLPMVRRYAAIYTLGGLIIVGASGYIVTISPTSPDSAILGATALLGAGVGLTFPIGVSIISFVLPKQWAPDAALLNTLGISFPACFTVALAGCVYENLGHRDLSAALRPFGFSDAEIREALAGASARLTGAVDQQIQMVASTTVTRIIAKEFYILVVAGIVMITAAAFMKWEALDFKGRRPAEDTDAK